MSVIIFIYNNHIIVFLGLRGNNEVAGFGQHKAEFCFRCSPKGVVQFSVGESESGIEDGSFSEPARSRTGTHISQASSTFETEDSEIVF